MIKLGFLGRLIGRSEKGSCYPDITLLPALARLLRVDLNTLLSFNDDLSDKEIGEFSNELYQIASTKGFNIAFESAMDKIHQFPNCYKLILTVATLLRGLLYMFGVDDKESYESKIENLYVRALESEDLEVKNQEGFDQFSYNFINTLKNDIDGELSFVKNNKEFNELLKC